MAYTITAVGEQVDSYQGKYGEMKTYKVKFQETGETVISLSQKPETAPPKPGDSLDGSIDMSGSYGPRFKKAFAPKPGGHSGGGGRGGSVADPHAMYTAYAKDLVVALIASLTEPTSDKFKTEYEAALAFVTKGAKVLESAAKPDETTQTGGGF